MELAIIIIVILMYSFRRLLFIFKRKTAGVIINKKYLQELTSSQVCNERNKNSFPRIHFIKLSGQKSKILLV